MATKTKKGTEFKGLTTSLREFSQSLPTEAEKQELQRSLSEIITFLSDIQRSLAELPVQEHAAAMDDALRALDQFAERAKNNKTISALLGRPLPRPSRPKSAPHSAEETAAGERLLNELQSMPIDHMRAKLQDEIAVPMRSLQALAWKLSIRSARRIGRDVLVHQIASKISNYRGYEGLRAGTETD